MLLVKKLIKSPRMISTWTSVLTKYKYDTGDVTFSSSKIKNASKNSCYMCVILHLFAFSQRFYPKHYTV